MSHFHLTITTPEGERYNGEACFFSLRGTEGDVAILPGHSPFITAVKPGRCVIRSVDGQETKGYLKSGLLFVTKGEVSLTTTAFTTNN